MRIYYLIYEQKLNYKEKNMTDTIIDETEYSYVLNCIQDYASGLENIIIKYFYILNYVNTDGISDELINSKLNTIYIMSLNIISNFQNAISDIINDTNEYLNKIKKIDDGDFYGF